MRTSFRVSVGQKTILEPQPSYTSFHDDNGDYIGKSKAFLKQSINERSQALKTIREKGPVHDVRAV